MLGSHWKSAINLKDEAIVNSSGTPSRLPMPMLRQLFSAGSNVGINNGLISATTDPSVTTELGTLTSGLSTTNANLAALAAKIPTGGYVSLNAQGQITAPMAGSVTLGTVQVSSTSPNRTLAAMSLDTVNVVDFGCNVKWDR